MFFISDIRLWIISTHVCETLEPSQFLTVSTGWYHSSDFLFLEWKCESMQCVNITCLERTRDRTEAGENREEIIFTMQVSVSEIFKPCCMGIEWIKWWWKERQGKEYSCSLCISMQVKHTRSAVTQWEVGGQHGVFWMSVLSEPRDKHAVSCSLCPSLTVLREHGGLCMDR